MTYNGLKGWFHLRIRAVEAARDALRWLSMTQHADALKEIDPDKAEELREHANLTHDYAEEFWRVRHEWQDKRPQGSE
jgi:hypothetical protein